MRKKQKIVIVVGPTSSGKSALAVALARKFNGEVISTDSRQVYRGLNIGTGKITEREMRGVPHHLLDIASPKKIFTAHDYVIHATDAIASVVCRGKLPVIAGGTGLYIDALTGRIVLPDVPVNPQLRAKLQKKTAAQLFTLLKKRDPRRAKTIERQNPRRLIRALEIVASLGSVPKKDLRSPFLAMWIGIAPPPKELERRIRARLGRRLKQGMVAEAKQLHTSGLSYKRMEALGLEYRSLSRFLQHKITRQELESELNRDIRRYAKRQILYWKRNKEIRWFRPSQKRLVKQAVQNWLKR